MMDLAQRIIEDFEALSENGTREFGGESLDEYRRSIAEVVRFIKADVRGTLPNERVVAHVYYYVEGLQVSGRRTYAQFMATHHMMDVMNYYQKLTNADI